MRLASMMAAKAPNASSSMVSIPWLAMAAKTTSPTTRPKVPDSVARSPTFIMPELHLRGIAFESSDMLGASNALAQTKSRADPIKYCHMV